MLATHRTRILVVGALLALLATGLALWLPAARPAQSGVTAILAAPPFLNVARAEEVAIAGVIQEEAGIAAWYNVGTSVDLNLVKNAYRVIETQTADYILGSVPVPDHTEEWHDVHLYVHKDGWFLAYYLSADPIGKIINWASFNSAIPTKFEAVLAAVTSTAGLPTPSSLTYYDFRYPNATKLMLLYEDAANGNEFRIKVPSSYVYYARSAGLQGNGWVSGNFAVNGRSVIACGGWCWGDIAATDFAPDVFHTIAVDNRGVLALLYRDTP